MDKQRKEYRKKNWKHIQQKTKEYRDSHLWLKTLSNLRSRCNNPNFPKYEYYGGRGIKALITSNEIKKLWFRDKAYLMKKPSIDRIDSKKDYTFENCRFIEHRENVAKDSKKIVFQYNKDGKLLKKWNSFIEAGMILQIHPSGISACVRGIQKTAGGYIWKLNINQ